MPMVRGYTTTYWINPRIIHAHALTADSPAPPLNTPTKLNPKQRDMEVIREISVYSIMTGDVLYIIPLITRLLAKNEKITSHGVYFYNLIVTSIRCVDQQRNSPPKSLTSLSNRRCWGMTSYWYLRSGTKEVISSGGTRVLYMWWPGWWPRGGHGYFRGSVDHD